VRRWRALRGQRGFTLIELLVVIVILGILAAVVVFAVNGITDKGKNSSCKIEERTVNTALQAYYAQYNSYPSGTDVDAMYAELHAKNLLQQSAPGATTGGTYSAGDYVATCPA
jgi:general secretion pathway protein G